MKTIADLNDKFRHTFMGGRVVMTDGVAALPDAERIAILARVQAFSAFDRDNDPHSEHDFGAVHTADNKVFWKIDYYDAALEYGSEDPADPTVTTRVLTIMLSDEY